MLPLYIYSISFFALLLDKFYTQKKNLSILIRLFSLELLVFFMLFLIYLTFVFNGYCYIIYGTINILYEYWL